VGLPQPPKPGVLMHRAAGGDEIWTVRRHAAADGPLHRPQAVRHRDRYADGYVRFTTRSNIEFMVADQAKVEPLIQALQKEASRSAAPPTRYR